jgi:cyclopropane fatty-acyl-phospholipid synthase-like methyltransferase
MPDGLDFLAKEKTRAPARLLTDWFARLDLHGGVALDLGCGSGAEAEFLARNGFMVDAIDKSETAIKYTKERCQGLTVEAILGDFMEFQLRPDYYSLAVAIYSLPFMEKKDCETLLASVQKALKPGGAALLTVYGPEHAWKDRADMSFWTLGEFRSLWDGWDILDLAEYKGPWPLVSGTEIFQHRIQLVARKSA